MTMDFFFFSLLLSLDFVPLAVWTREFLMLIISRKKVYKNIYVDVNSI